MIHGAAPCPPEVKRRMLDWWGPVVVEYYAATEGGGTLITAAGVAGPARLGRHAPGPARGCGCWTPTATTPRPASRAWSTCGWATRTFEYYGRRGEDARRPGAAGMFTVGDIGYLDDDGYLYLCDRKSDMIISGGVNIYPAEIERELSCHPAVADVAVFGIPHDEWGEEIKAVVQPAAACGRPGADRRAAGVPRRPAGQVQAARGPSTTSPNCRATPTASSTSGGCAIRTGKARERVDLRPNRYFAGSATAPSAVPEHGARASP